jgi:hypothetical protein
MADMTDTSSAEGVAWRAVVVSCWLCGIRQHQNQMVPDGGSACSDIRWYCRDTRACTERWTSDQRHTQAVRDTSGRGVIAARLSGNGNPAPAMHGWRYLG